MKTVKHISLIMALCLAFAASACAKKEPETSAVSESVSEVTREKEPVASVSEPEPEPQPEEKEFPYSTYNELNTELTKQTRETLLSTGAISEDETIFYTDMYDDFEEDDSESLFYEDDSRTEVRMFVSFDDSGFKNLYVASYDVEIKNGSGRFDSLSVRVLDEYAVEVRAEDESRVPYELGQLLSSQLCWLRTDSLETVRAFVKKATADGTLTRYSKVIDYIYEKSEDKELFKDPVKLAMFFFKDLDESGIERFKCDVDYDIVRYKEPDGRMDYIGFKCFKKLPGGVVLYYPLWAHEGIYEEAMFKQEHLATVTAEILDEAYPEYPPYGEKLTNVFYKVAETEDGSATLYGLFSDDCPQNGGVIRIKDKIIPIYMGHDLSWNTGFWAGDFDHDGKKEYAFTANDGHGTGFYHEALYVVDPDDNNTVCVFRSYDDVSLGSDDVYGKIKSEYDETTNEVSFWIEDQGVAGPKGSITLPDNYWTEYWGGEETFAGLGFGDLFYVRCEKGKLFFVAKGGILAKESVSPDYEFSVDLLGDLTYKNGVVTLDNLRLQPGSDLW